MPSINLGKWISLGAKIVSHLPAVISAVEILKRGFSGGDKKAAAIEATKDFVAITENLIDKDVVNDPEVVKAVGAAIDALVNVQNVVAAVKAAKVAKSVE